MRDQFVTAFIYCYGGTRKEALKAYKNADTGYIKAVIASYYGDVKKAFYND